MVAQYRQLGKILNYALIYLASANTIALQTNSTVEEAQQNIDAYFSYPNGFYGLGNWLKRTAAMASERRWTRTAMGSLLFVNESNAKGLDAGVSSVRKAVNGTIQGLASEQAKLATIKTQKRFDVLNFKYRGEVLRGREGRIVAVVHDELNGVVPGDCEMIPKIDEKKGLISYKPKLDLDIGEHALAFEYGEAIRVSMEEAMAETFEIYCQSDIPAGADLAIGKLWIH